MTGFEPQITGAISDRSTNCATTVSHGAILIAFYDLDFEFVWFYDYICSVLNVGFFSWDSLLVEFSIFECFNC